MGKETLRSARSLSEGECADDGSDTELDNAVGKQSAVKYWDMLVSKEEQYRRADPDWQPESLIYDRLHWLVKVKAECTWSPPLLNMLKKMESSCVEKTLQVEVTRKVDLPRLQNMLTEKYYLRDSIRLNAGTIMVPRGSHLLPLGSFEGKN